MVFEGIRVAVFLLFDSGSGVFLVFEGKPTGKPSHVSKGGPLKKPIYAPFIVVPWSLVHLCREDCGKSNTCKRGVHSGAVAKSLALKGKK